MLSRSTLPDLNTLDVEALKALILVQRDELIATQERLLSRESEIEHLRLLIAKLQRMQFGRRSEKVARQIEQLELKLEELEAARAEAVVVEPARTATIDVDVPAAKPSRRALPAHLQREVHTHEPAEPCCPECGGILTKLGEDVSEILEYVPASFKVIRHVRPKLSCSGCDAIVQAPAPSRPIERG